MFNSIRKLATVLLGLSTVAPPSLFAAADAVVDVTLPEIVSASYHGFCIPGAENTHYSAVSTDAVNLSYEGLAPSNTSIESFFTATHYISSIPIPLLIVNAVPRRIQVTSWLMILCKTMLLLFKFIRGVVASNLSLRLIASLHFFRSLK